LETVYFFVNYIVYSYMYAQSILVVMVNFIKALGDFKRN